MTRKSQTVSRSGDVTSCRRYVVDASRPFAFPSASNSAVVAWSARHLYPSAIWRLTNEDSAAYQDERGAGNCDDPPSTVDIISTEESDLGAGGGEDRAEDEPALMGYCCSSVEAALRIQYFVDAVCYRTAARSALRTVVYTSKMPSTPQPTLVSPRQQHHPLAEIPTMHTYHPCAP